MTSADEPKTAAAGVRYPVLCEERGDKRLYELVSNGRGSVVVFALSPLADATEAWTPVAEGDEGSYRFFKVGVGMPEKK